MPISSNPIRRITVLLAVSLACCNLSCPFVAAAPLKIMPVGDSITAGYTDNTSNSANGAGGWNVPFEFGYRRQLYHLLTAAGYDFRFVGASAEPFNFLETGYGDPTKGGTVSPTFDLRDIDGVNQNGHRGYGGIRIHQMTPVIAGYLNADDPDIVLLMIGINQISANSPGLLDTLVDTIFNTKPDVHLIIARITPRSTYNADLFNLNTHILETLVPNFIAQGRKITSVDQYKNFLTDPADPESIDPTLFSNNINHPTNPAYDTMAGTWFEGILAVAPPTLPVLDQTTVSSATPQGGTIGNFAQPPAPSTETLAFSLVDGAGDADNTKFTISGSELRIGNHDFTADPDATTYSIRVRATGNPGGQTGDRVFTLRLMVDSDGDLLPDAWEFARTQPNPNLNDLTKTGDFDKDGLTDAEEYQLSLGPYPGIDPTKPDTDGDGLPDGDEIEGAGQRPPTDPTSADTDADSVSDLNEDNTGIYASILQTGTDPTLADSDGDGIADGVEILQDTDPADSTSPPPATLVNSSSTTAGTYAPDISSNDLLHGLTGANAMHIGWNRTDRANPAKLTDGIHGAYTSNPVDGGWSAAEGSLSTFTLPAGAGFGWDLTEITTIADWSGGGFGNQHYDVAVRRVDEDEFTPLASVDFQPLGAEGVGGTRVRITRNGGPLAGNVAQIRFTMLPTVGSGGLAIYREFDVFGSQSMNLAPGPPLPVTEILAFAPPAGDIAQAAVTWRSHPSKTYRVEASENLVQWDILHTAFPSGGVTSRFQGQAELSTKPRAFYRVFANP